MSRKDICPMGNRHGVLSHGMDQAGACSKIARCRHQFKLAIPLGNMPDCNTRMLQIQWRETKLNEQFRLKAYRQFADECGTAA